VSVIVVGVNVVMIETEIECRLGALIEAVFFVTGQ